MSHPGPDWSPTSMASEFLSRNRKFLPTSLFKAGENIQNAEGEGQISLRLNCPWECFPKRPSACSSLSKAEIQVDWDTQVNLRKEATANSAVAVQGEPDRSPWSWWRDTQVHLRLPGFCGREGLGRKAEMGTGLLLLPRWFQEAGGGSGG